MRPYRPLASIIQDAAGFSAVEIAAGMAAAALAALVLAGIAASGTRLLASSTEQAAKTTRAAQAAALIAADISMSRFSRTVTWERGVLFPYPPVPGNDGAPAWSGARAFYLSGTELAVADIPWDWAAGPPCRPDEPGCTGWTSRPLLPDTASFGASRDPALRIVRLTITDQGGSTYEIAAHPEH